VEQSKWAVSTLEKSKLDAEAMIEELKSKMSVFMEDSAKVRPRHETGITSEEDLIQLRYQDLVKGLGTTCNVLGLSRFL
jgi:hypothetical protein